LLTPRSCWRRVFGWRRAFADAALLLAPRFFLVPRFCWRRDLASAALLLRLATDEAHRLGMVFAIEVCRKAKVREVALEFWIGGLYGIATALRMTSRTLTG
jgi:hypothetical protein